VKKLVAIEATALYSQFQEAKMEIPDSNGGERKMRKSLWVIPVLFILLVAAIGAPPAQADNIYTITQTGMYSFSFTTDPIPALTGPTEVLAAGLSSVAITGADFAPEDAATLDYVILDYASMGETALFFSNFGGSLFAFGGDFSLADYDTVGIYAPIGGNLETLSVSSSVSPVPEPSTAILMMLGIGIVGAIGRRMARGLPQAA
jgi:hypothetical protein